MRDACRATTAIHARRSKTIAKARDLEIPFQTASIASAAMVLDRRHIDAIARNDVDAARRAIVNPATLSRERQLDTCMQCHLESTSSPLPFQIRRYEHPPFSFVPGQPLGDYFIHFDHAPGTVAMTSSRSTAPVPSAQVGVLSAERDDVRHVSRSARCSARCEAVKRYVAICQSCHANAHPRGVPRVAGANAGATCIDCHMPKRRAEDAVHVVMTDHYIQRERPGARSARRSHRGAGSQRGVSRRSGSVLSADAAARRRRTNCISRLRRCSRARTRGRHSTAATGDRAASPRARRVLLRPRSRVRENGESRRCHPVEQRGARARSGVCACAEGAGGRGDGDRTARRSRRRAREGRPWRARAMRMRSRILEMCTSSRGVSRSGPRSPAARACARSGLRRRRTTPWG